MASAEREPITESGGGAPSGGPGSRAPGGGHRVGVRGNPPEAESLFVFCMFKGSRKFAHYSNKPPCRTAVLNRGSPGRGPISPMPKAGSGCHNTRRNFDNLLSFLIQKAACEWYNRYWVDVTERFEPEQGMGHSEWNHQRRKHHNGRKNESTVHMIGVMANFMQFWLWNPKFSCHGNLPCKCQKSIWNWRSLCHQ